MGYRSNLVDIDVVLRRETDKAWGIVDPQGGADLVWIPKAWGELEGGDPPSCRGVLTMEDWRATLKKLT